MDLHVYSVMVSNSRIFKWKIICTCHVSTTICHSMRFINIIIYSTSMAEATIQNGNVHMKYDNITVTTRPILNRSSTIL